MQLHRSSALAIVRREAETVRASDPLFGVSLSAAILDDSGSAMRWPIKSGNGSADERMSASGSRGSPVTRITPRPSGRGGEPGSAKHCRSRSCDARTAAAAVELQGIRRAAGLARVELALASRPRRSRLIAAKPVVRLPSGEHSSFRFDRNVGISRSCNGHHRGRIRRHRRRGDDHQNVTIGRKDALPGRAPRIGRGVLLSSGATILGDVSIGDFAKIGAGSVVTNDVPRGCTAIGVPARLTNCPEGVLA